MLTHWSTFTQKEIEMEPQTLWAAISIFVSFLFTVATAVWIVRKAIGDLQVEMTKSFGELRTETAKSFGEVRGEIKVLSTRMDGLDNRMDGLENRVGDLGGQVGDLGGQVRDLGGQVRGINEFLRRDSVKDSEKDKES